jgi:predicted Rdx family selenoprotein
VAAQIVAGHNREVAVTLTPVGEGRFEIYVNGDEVYNRKSPPETSKSGADVRAVVVDVAEVARGKLLAALRAEAPAIGH